MNPKLNVLYGSTDFFAEMTGVSMISLFENNKDLDISVYIFETEISEINKEKLSTVARQYEAELIMVRNPSLVGAMPMPTVANYWGGVWYEHLPITVEKLLYLDSDTVVVGSLRAIAEMDLHENEIAAVSSPQQAKMRQMYNLPSDVYCPNGGVLLLNLIKCRETKYLEKLKDSIEKFEKITGNSFTAGEASMGVAAKDRFILLDASYNITTDPVLFKYDKPIYKNFFSTIMESNYTSQEFSDALEFPHIIHYTTAACGRPWERNCQHPLKHHYTYYKSMSPWREARLFKPNRNPIKHLIILMFLILPPKLACWFQYKFIPAVGRFRRQIIGRLLA